MELKSCPFCDGKAGSMENREVYTDISYASVLWVVECLKCVNRLLLYILQKKNAINS